MATTSVAVPLRGRPAMVLSVVSLVGLAAFTWPLLLPPASTVPGQEHAGDAPWLLLLLLPLLLAVVGAELGGGKLDTRAVALLGVLAAVGAALRLASLGVAGVELVWFLLIPAGRVLGRGFGMALGMLTLLVSALVTGGVGPWLPFQMLAAGWIGFGAGCLPRASGSRERWMLAAYGAVAALLYGLVMDLWFWPFLTTGTTLGPEPGAGALVQLQNFLGYHLVTAMGFDTGRAITTSVAILLAGRPVLLALRRAARRARFDDGARPQPAQAAETA